MILVTEVCLLDCEGGKSMDARCIMLGTFLVYRVHRGDMLVRNLMHQHDWLANLGAWNQSASTTCPPWWTGEEHRTNDGYVTRLAVVQATQ
jgi:hypothetical protein